MTGAIYLNYGDATFSSSFAKIMRSDEGYELKASFKPERGKEFVVLLLGETDKGTPYVDVEEMLNKLGFYREPKRGTGDE